MDQKPKRLENRLCKAVKDGDPRSVELLLSQGARSDIVGSRGVAAIHLAVGKETEKNTRCLKLLLQHGADPNVRSSEGLTPLHIAAVWGCYQNLKVLLMNGGNPNLKDNESNTPGQLAEQQENKKCAQLLQKYEASSEDIEDDDLPQFQYSVYSDQTDTSSYPESEFSFTSQSSVISDFGSALLSSTRHSSFFNLSTMNGCPVSHRDSDIDSKRYPSQDWINQTDGPSVLSSTRISAVGPAGGLPILKEHDLFADDEVLPSTSNAVINDYRFPPFRRDTLPALHSRPACRKSVSFRDVDEYFPVFSPEHPKQQPPVDGSPSGLSLELSEYSEFMDSDRMATVLHGQGIDVTSPDHVYVFCRESSESPEEELEKTVISHCPLIETDDEKENEDVQDVQVNIPEQQGRSCVGSSSSGTTSSHYSSCDSDHYTSALDVPTNCKQTLFSAVKEGAIGTESDMGIRMSTGAGFEKQDDNYQSLRPQTDLKLENEHNLPSIFNKLDLSEVKHPTNDAIEGCTHVDEVTTKTVANTSLADDLDLSFTQSPFVTGRTPSRLSRCSLRNSRTPESIFVTSLFEETLPMPVRTWRQTPRSQNSDHFYNSPQVNHRTASYSGSSTRGDGLPTESQDTQSGTLGADYSIDFSQADTLILPKGRSDSGAESQTLSDTVILEKNPDTTVDAYERNLADIALAIRGKGVTEDGHFLTDDLTSTDEATTKGDVNVVSCKNRADSQDDLWITEDWSSQPDSVSSSSSSSYFSPKPSRADSSDLPCTPGTGYTPRYSMSRLSTCQRLEHLANLSYTPGGRPHIEDLDEPVEYLYTDMEQGHKLIEIHIPPTANTSLSSSLSTTSSEETILYDWRSVQKDVMNNKERENQIPQTVLQKEENDEVKMFPETKGLTDRELRLKLKELGESPGPISSRTRPTYMRRLCRLLQESKIQAPRPEKPTDQTQTDSVYSPELYRALQTFDLPSCQTDEQALCEQFDQPDQNRKWREGIIKSSFNYLLLDPRVTKNLPFRSHTMTPQECFQTFIHSIFYVGKGKRSRPYSHLYEALEYYRGDKTAKKLCPKVQHILQVWNAEQGVISLHCFQNVIPVEAYTREACMVEAIGLKKLTNQKRGDFYGVVSNWQLKRKRELGTHLLYRAMQIFLAEGERQLRPADIRQ